MVRPSFDCPECNGSGWQDAVAKEIFGTSEPCWFCDGTGYQTDETSEEDIIRWE